MRNALAAMETVMPKPTVSHGANEKLGWRFCCNLYAKWAGGYLYSGCNFTWAKKLACYHQMILYSQILSTILITHLVRS